MRKKEMSSIEENSAHLFFREAVRASVRQALLVVRRLLSRRRLCERL